MKTNVMSLGKIFSRDELKKIRGGDGSGYGDNPNCAGSTGTDDWYCCKASSTEHLGNMTCNEASNKCNGYKITNDSGRC